MECIRHRAFDRVRLPFECAKFRLYSLVSPDESALMILAAIIDNSKTLARRLNSAPICLSYKRPTTGAAPMLAVVYKVYGSLNREDFEARVEAAIRYYKKLIDATRPQHAGLFGMRKPQQRPETEETHHKSE